MMRVQVTAFKGEPLAQPLSADFDEMGGSIGRSDGNTLVLPDAQRYVSRTQASIRFRGGKYLLRDAGSATPTYLNETAVGSGNEVPLDEGDELRIGEYTLRVSINRAAVAATLHNPDPLADPFGHDAPERAAPVLAPPSAPLKQPEDPFAHSAEPNVIPHDFDPFADLSPLPGQGRALIPDGPGMASSASPGVDDLFGLKQPSSWDPLGPEDPLSGAAHAMPGELRDDPLAGLGAAAIGAPRQASQRDDSPALSGAFRPPQVKGEPPRREPDPFPPHAVAPAPPGEPDAKGMMFSWESSPAADAEDEIKSVIVPSPKDSEGAREIRAPERRVVPPTPPIRPVERPVPARMNATPSGAQAHDTSDGELLQAFLSGAGASNLRIPEGLTPELMNLLGGLLRESIGGTLQLLLARALTKREVRAEATMIVARENNPLKFSPTVETALMHLLVPHGHGFMPPVTAVKDAYNDLRSHQFGIMAGMRAALTSVLARFNPAQLEKRLTDKRGLSSILPSSRKAKLWESYEHLYTEISREAEDDFQTLFGKEFLKAYEAQIQKLEQEDGDNKS
ncbi:MAG: type VI secretion system-associated FHA domain protein TagH [Burkholderiales bacterium]